MIKSAIPYLSLFTSLSTLVCCALPALFVSLGLGATLVSALSAAPQLIWLSENKGIVFGVAGALLLAAAWLRRTPPACPADPELAARCARLQRVSAAVFHASIFFYALGAFFAFAAPLLLG